LRLGGFGLELDVDEFGPELVFFLGAAVEQLGNDLLVLHNLGTDLLHRLLLSLHYPGLFLEFQNSHLLLLYLLLFALEF